MSGDFDGDDPLVILLREWQQVGFWLWTFLAVGAMALFVLPQRPHVGLLVFGAGLGQALLKLGHVWIVSANELRKELRAQRRPAGPDEPPVAGPAQRRR